MYIYIYVYFMSRTTNTCFIRDVVAYLVLLLFVQNFSFDIYIYIMGIDDDEEEIDGYEMRK